MDNELQFAQPLWIWIGLAVCLALAWGMTRWNRRRNRDLERIAHSRLLERLTESVSRRRRLVKQAVWLVALLLVFVAAARPQYGFEFREVKRRGIDLVFAVDTSRSMLAEDVAPNRLERSRLAITDFVEQLEGDRVGLIPFAGNAFSLCPLTLDYGAFFQSLDALNTDIIPHQGTDLASAVREANRLFDEEGNNHRILILITDGEDLQGAVMEAVANAKEQGMIIHTVGVGDPSGALIPVTLEDGGQDFIRDETGEPVRSALDEETLKEIAEATGGLYAPLGQGGRGLETIHREKLRLVPKSELNQRLDRIPLERYEWPLAAAILLFLVEFLLGERRRPAKRKAPVISVARRKAAAGVMVFVFAGFSAEAQELPLENSSSATPSDPNAPQALYNAGTNAYRAGEYEQAEETLALSLGNTEDLSLQQKSYYNLGNARYRLGERTVGENPEATIGKWEEAVKSFEDALVLDPEDEDARFNRDFVKEKLEELKQQQDEQEQEGEQEQQQDEQAQDSQSEDEPSEEQEESGEEGSDEADEQSEPEPGEDPSEESDAAEGEDSQDGEPEEPGESESESESESDAEGDEEEPAEPQPEPGQGEDSGREGEEEPRAAEPSQEQPPEGEEREPGDQPSFSEERREPGAMSREEAAQLLDALEKDELSVLPLPEPDTYRRMAPNNTTRGKTW
ncbi:MAG: VWA domain-containing protein [Verrucomicrobiales bacterium]